MWLLTSPRAICDAGKVRLDVVAALTEVSEFAEVTVLSNSLEPEWFSGAFDSSRVQFLHVRGRQQGNWLQDQAEKSNVPPHQVIVVAASREDLQMAKNNRALLLGVDWADDKYVATVGLKVVNPSDLAELVRLAQDWNGRSWLRAEGDNYSVEALCDASSTQFKSEEQQKFGRAVTEAVKVGTTTLNSILALTAGSLIRAGIPEVKNLLWGVYPSSSSNNDDTETLSDFASRLRTTVSRVQFARLGEPLFQRHHPSAKRSAGEGGDRKDPTGEVESLHLNPFYKSRLTGRNVVVLDDFTTYGVSMGVAAGFLRAAKASSMTGIALGKFGNQLRNYEVQICSDPFRPILRADWTYRRLGWNSEEYSSEDQGVLRRLLIP
jgi:hypothetical protein